MEENKNKPKKAVAIKYDKKDVSPTVIAKGKGIVAEKILEKGENIPVFEDAALVNELEKIDIGQNIPPELYEAVAQVLVFISELDRKNGKNKWS